MMFFQSPFRLSFAGFTNAMEDDASFQGFTNALWKTMQVFKGSIWKKGNLSLYGVFLAIFYNIKYE